jgi:hypothetical protein
MSSDSGGSAMRFVCKYGRIAKNSFLYILAYCSLTVLQAGCVPSRVIVPPENAPAYVREIKYLRVYNFHSQLDTGVDLNKDERCSIMATGRLLHRWQRSKDAAYYLMMFIDDHYTKFFFSPDYCGGTFISKKSGRLYLGIDPYIMSQGYSGYFDVAVIVWRTEDLSQISGFLNKLKQEAPDHIGIGHAATQARALKEIADWRAQLSKEIENTKDEIETLQQQGPEQGGSAANERLQRVQVLEKRLTELTARLAELQEIPQALLVEKERTSDLSRKLEDLQHREKELMNKMAEGRKTPPALFVSSPEDGSKSESGMVKLSGAVEDDNGLDKIEVHLNGRFLHVESARDMATGKNGVLRQISFYQSIHLAPGTNLLSVKATDIEGFVAEKVITVHYPLRRPNVWAVVVGINEYPNLPKLKYAVNDAREFYRLLVEKNRVPAENIMLLLDKQADLRNLRKALGTHLRSHASENDLVIIFFAGHGSTERDSKSPDQDGLEKYLLPHDTDPKDLYSSAIPVREIAYIFDRIRSERLIFIADSCYSGASGGRTVNITGMRSGIHDGFLDRIASGKGKVILSASAANEISVETDELRHGVFTYYLLEGLSGVADTDADGVITVDEVFKYVSEKVPRATGQEQHPVKKGSVEGSLVLGIAR